MKKRLYILMVLMPLFSACQEDKLQKFEDPIASVYFYIDEKKEVEEMLYSFIYTFENEVVLNVPVRCSGLAAAYDRHFRVEVAGDLTTAVSGKHYSIPSEALFPADAYEAAFPVTLYNQDTVLRSQSFVLTLQLAGSADFELGDKERQTVRIVISNRLEKPEAWQDWIFGAWSRVKHKHLIRIAGKDLPSADELNNDFNFWYYGVGQELKNYFIKNYPVLDENQQVIEPW